jgi:hypothetical protein
MKCLMQRNNLYKSAYICIYIYIYIERERERERPKRIEMTEGLRKLHNEELHNLYASPNIIRMIKSRRIRWAGHVARMGAMKNTYRILVGKPGGRRPLGRPKSR